MRLIHTSKVQDHSHPNTHLSLSPHLFLDLFIAIDLKNLLSPNGYPRGVITYNMNDVVTRNRNKPKDPITTVPKRDVYIVLPYLGLQSKIITKQLKSCIYRFYGCINLKKIFVTLTALTLFSPTRTGLIGLSSLRT